MKLIGKFLRVFFLGAVGAGAVTLFVLMQQERSAEAAEAARFNPDKAKAAISKYVIEHGERPETMKVGNWRNPVDDGFGIWSIRLVAQGADQAGQMVEQALVCQVTTQHQVLRCL